MRNLAAAELSQKVGCESNNINVFCKKIAERDQESGLHDTSVNIISTLSSIRIDHNHITQHRMLTQEIMRDYTHAFLNIRDNHNIMHSSEHAL